MAQPAYDDDRIGNAVGISRRCMVTRNVAQAFQRACASGSRKLWRLIAKCRHGDMVMNLLGLILIASLSLSIVAVSLRLRAPSRGAYRESDRLSVD